MDKDMLTRDLLDGLILDREVKELLRTWISLTEKRITDLERSNAQLRKERENAS